MNWFRKLLRLHVHEWGPLECFRVMGRHGHVHWCKTCGDYKHAYGIVCHPK